MRQRCSTRSRTRSNSKAGVSSDTELHGAKSRIFSVRRCRITCIFVVHMPSEQPRKRPLAIIGGGAAGFFAAITAARQDPSAQVVIPESLPVPAKVRISGGGRCNVTHACFDPALLTGFYPRGVRNCGKYSVASNHGIPSVGLNGKVCGWKAEDDGRMFPDTDQSETIVRCLEAAQHAGVVVRKQSAVLAINPDPNGGMVLQLADGSLRPTGP